MTNSGCANVLVLAQLIAVGSRIARGPNSIRLHPASGTWWIQPNQTQYWGYDHLSWGYADFVYYRAERPARGLPMPCNTRIIQKMEIDCAGWREYTASNVLTLWMDMTTVTNCRNDMSSSACATQSYP